MEVKNLDHLVLTVANVESTCRFYNNALGMEIIEFGDARRALKFGNQIYTSLGMNLNPRLLNPHLAVPIYVLLQIYQLRQ